MYTERQIEAIVTGLHEKIVQGRVTEQEVILLLLILERTKKITVEQISDILMAVFSMDKERVLGALSTVRNIVTDQMIDEIVYEIHTYNKK